MYSLCFDTSSPKGVVAVLSDSQIVGSKDWTRAGSHSEVLVPGIDEALVLGSLKLRQMQRIVVGVGPGSFTGTRVGVSVAKTLAYTLQIPIVAVSSLEILAAGVVLTSPVGPTPFLAALKAPQGGVFLARYLSQPQWHEIQAPQAVRAKELPWQLTERHLCIGDAFANMAAPSWLANPELVERPAVDADQISCQAFARLRLDQRPTTTWQALLPLYLRPSTAEEKLEMES